ncbi:MAG TPA: hypothetical protein VI141_06990 [Acidimicrobiia bacterium]
MFARALSTVASLAVAAVGVLLAGCSPASFLPIPGDPLGICASVSSYGIEGVRGIGLALVVAATLALIATWVPTWRPGHKRRMRAVPENTLMDNLNRLNDESAPASARARSPEEVLAAELIGKVEAVETSMLGLGTPTREVTERWMGLLRQSNDLHNQGLLSTEDFSRINTRLLDLFAEPAGTRR